MADRAGTIVITPVPEWTLSSQLSGKYLVPWKKHIPSL